MPRSSSRLSLQFSTNSEVSIGSFFLPPSYFLSVFLDPTYWRWLVVTGGGNRALGKKRSDQTGYRTARLHFLLSGIVHNWTSQAPPEPSSLGLCSIEMAHPGVSFNSVGLPILVFRMQNSPAFLLCLPATRRSQAAVWGRGSIRQHIGFLVGSARVHNTRVT